MKIKIIFLLSFIFSVTLAYTQANDSLVYLKNFPYPAELKAMEGRQYDVEWAQRMKIKKLYFTDGREVCIGKKKVKIFDPTTKKTEIVKKDTDWGWFLITQKEGEWTYGQKKPYDKLDETFYAFRHGNETWILHKSNPLACICPAYVIGYIQKGKTLTRMLNEKELRRAIAEAKNVDKSQ